MLRLIARCSTGWWVGPSSPNPMESWVITNTVGTFSRLILGEVEELWDVVAVVRYPNRKAMYQMATSDGYMESEKHRTAGLAGQLNIEVAEGELDFE